MPLHQVSADPGSFHGMAYDVLVVDIEISNRRL